MSLQWKKRNAELPKLFLWKWNIATTHRHHVMPFMCLIKGTKLIVTWESLPSRGLTASKVNVSPTGPMGSNGWETWDTGEEMWRKDVASHRSSSSSQLCLSSGPRWSSTTGGRRRATTGGGRGRRRAEGERTGPYSLPRGSVVLISVRISNLNILSS